MKYTEKMVDDFLKNMLKNKEQRFQMRWYQNGENDVFNLIDNLENDNRLIEASRILLAYINLVMPKGKVIALDKDRPVLEFIREYKSDRFFEEIRRNISFVSRCNTKLHVQHDHIYY